MVEEEYRSRALHDLLGVKPRPVVVDAGIEEPKPNKTNASDGKPPSDRGRTKESQSVASAWGDDDDEIVILGASAAKSPKVETNAVEDEESDGGRYGIGQPPHKRQKTGITTPFMWSTMTRKIASPKKKRTISAIVPAYKMWLLRDQCRRVTRIGIDHSGYRRPLNLTLVITRSNQWYFSCHFVVVIHRLYISLAVIRLV